MSSVHAIEAESSVIGCALIYHDQAGDAFERLKPEHFYDGVHARLWSRILAIHARGGFPDAVSVAESMGDDQGFRQIGGLNYLADLVDQAAAWTLPAHVEMIIDRSVRREIRALGLEMAQRAEQITETSGEAILSEMERGAAVIAREASSSPMAVPAGLTALDMLEAAFRGEHTGSSTGFAIIDRVTGGLRDADVWIVGGRTSMGKSAFATGLSRGIALQGRGVMIFSLEMPLREIQARMIADLAYDPDVRYDEAFGVSNVRYSDILRGKATDHQKNAARQAAKQLAQMPITVSDAGGLTIDEIEAQAMRQMRAWRRAGVTPGAVVIDHLGLVQPSVRRSGDSKAAETSDTVNRLKPIAKRLHCPVIGLAQVNRNTEGRNDKRPTMADLNWSGAIEQIADLVCLLYRESYYLGRSQDPDEQVRAVQLEHDLELLIQKNRSGPICNLHAFVDVACNVVRDRDQPQRGAA